MSNSVTLIQAKYMSNSEANFWATGLRISRKTDRDTGNVIEQIINPEQKDAIGYVPVLYAHLDYIKGSVSKSGRARLLELKTFSWGLVNMPVQKQPQAQTPSPTSALSNASALGN